jgi:hypothetical protein
MTTETKLNLKEIKDLIDAMPPLSFGGPLTPALDEEGVVHLVDKNGRSRIFMSQDDYTDLVKYKDELAKST